MFVMSDPTPLSYYISFACMQHTLRKKTDHYKAVIIVVSGLGGFYWVIVDSLIK